MFELLCFYLSGYVILVPNNFLACRQAVAANRMTAHIVPCIIPFFMIIIYLVYCIN